MVVLLAFQKNRMIGNTSIESYILWNHFPQLHMVDSSSNDTGVFSRITDYLSGIERMLEELPAPTPEPVIISKPILKPTPARVKSIVQVPEPTTSPSRPSLLFAMEEPKEHPLSGPSSYVDNAEDSHMPSPRHRNVASRPKFVEFTAPEHATLKRSEKLLLTKEIKALYCSPTNPITDPEEIKGRLSLSVSVPYIVGTIRRIGQLQRVKEYWEARRKDDDNLENILPECLADISYRSRVRRAIDTFLAEHARPCRKDDKQSLFREIRLFLHEKYDLSVGTLFIEQHYLVHTIRSIASSTPANQTGVVGGLLTQTDAVVPRSPESMEKFQEPYVGKKENKLKVPESKAEWQHVGSLLTAARLLLARRPSLIGNAEPPLEDMERFLANAGYSLSASSIQQYFLKGAPKQETMTVFVPEERVPTEKTFLLPEEYGRDLRRSYGANISQLLEIQTGVRREFWDNALHHVVGLTVGQMSMLYDALPGAKMPVVIDRLIKQHSVA